MTLWPPYLFPFGARVSFEAGESWGALWEEGRVRFSPNPASTTAGGSPGRHSPWARGGHRGLGIPGDLVHPETQPAPCEHPPVPAPLPAPLPHARPRASSPPLCPPPCQLPSPMPAPVPTPGLLSLTTGPGIPRRPSGPGFPGAPWGPMGPVFPGGPSKPASPCRRQGERMGPCRALVTGPEHCSDLSTPRYLRGGAGYFPCSCGSRLAFLHLTASWAPSPWGHASYGDSGSYSGPTRVLAAVGPASRPLRPRGSVMAEVARADPGPRPRSAGPGRTDSGARTLHPAPQATTEPPFLGRLMAPPRQ